MTAEPGAAYSEGKAAVAVNGAPLFEAGAAVS